MSSVIIYVHMLILIEFNIVCQASDMQQKMVLISSKMYVLNKGHEDGSVVWVTDNILKALWFESLRWENFHLE